jgi:hypothetical protein
MPTFSVKLALIRTPVRRRIMSPIYTYAVDARESLITY